MKETKSDQRKLFNAAFPDFLITRQILFGCVKWVLFPVAKQKEREVDHSASSKVKVENEWSCTSSFSICFQFREKNKFTFISADDFDAPTSSERQQLTIESLQTNFRNERIFHWQLLFSKLVYVYLSKKPTSSSTMLSKLRFGQNICMYSKDYASPSGRAVKGVGLRPLACWDYGFDLKECHPRCAYRNYVCWR